MASRLDQKIISALQINPRISWSRLASILGSDPKTLSNHWESLVEARKAWTSFIVRTPPREPNHVRVAYVDLTYDIRQRDVVIESLKRQPLIYGLKSVTGERGLQVEVVGDSLTSIDDLIHRYVATCPGVKSLRSRFLHTIYRDGTQWRMRALSSEEELAVRRTLPATGGTRLPTLLHRALVNLLSSDPRLPVNQVSERLGVSAATASRNISTVLASRWASHRIDVAHTHLGWEVEVILLLQGHLQHAQPLITQLGETFDLRLAASTSGTANIMMAFWLGRVTEIDDLENWFHKHAPRVRILDRSLVPRVWKRFGAHLDTDGLRDGSTPVGVSDLRLP